jgi:hypothetical protein
MGLFSSGGYPVTSVTDDLLTRVEAATDSITPATEPDTLGDGERALVHVRPYGDSDGYDTAVEFVRDLYQSPSTGGGQSAEAMEWWFTDGQLGQRYCTASPGQFEQAASARYQNSSVQSPDRTFLDLRSDEYVAATRLRLRQDCAFPICHQNASLDALSSDPYTALASALVGPDDTRALIQIAFQSVDKYDWYQRGAASSSVDDIAERRKEGTVKGEWNPRIVDSQSDKKAANDMQRQRGRAAFQTSVRIVATAPTKPGLQERMADLIGAFEAFDYATTEQAFVPKPLSGRDLTAGLIEAAGRELPTRGRLKRALFGREQVLTDDELAGLVHLPNRDINAPLLDWERMESGGGTPGSRNQFDGEGDPSTSRAQPTATGPASAPESGEAATGESGQQQAHSGAQSASSPPSGAAEGNPAADTVSGEHDAQTASGGGEDG